MNDTAIDPRTRAALARLTAAERECLARRLRHQTAKEMAIDLGISPHAVEKRLKMARAKLGLSSSLEAARVMVAAEGYQQPAPHAADLAIASSSGQSWLRKPLVLGGTAMTLIAAAVLAFAMQAAPDGAAPFDGRRAAPLPSPNNQTPEAGKTIKIGMGDLGSVETSPERARNYVRQMFDREDKDRSGYIDFAEAPDRLEMAEPRPAGSPPLPYSEAKIVKVLEGDEARTSYIHGSDKDDDGRISFEEYAAARAPYYEQRGIPLVPADWTPVP